MTYEEAIQNIESLHWFGSRSDPRRIRSLMERLGNPQDRLRFIHVAGTNGKGTTCELLSSVLCCAGYRTGLYLSPHVEDFCERMQIDGQMVSHEEIASLAGRVFPEVRKMRSQGELVTKFEIVTAIALLWYAERNCDLVVLEVGLGGRLDATNVIQKPLVAVIVSISLDHTQILGDTVEQIAREKCGIIKEGGVTVSYPGQTPGAAAVIRRIAAQRHNQLIDAASSAVKEISTSLSGTELSWRGLRLHLPFLGEHQVKNAETALTVLNVLREMGYSVPDDAIKRGFSKAKLPARFEILSRAPLVILDGAHNPNGTDALAAAIRLYLAGRNLVAVMGMLEDKDIDASLKNLSRLFSYVVTAEPSSPRAIRAAELAERWRRLGTPAVPASGYSEALRTANAKLRPGGAVLICGSLYLAGDLRRRALQLWNRPE